MTAKRVCILGAGNMGRALLGGLLRSGTRAEQLTAADPAAPARAALMRDFGITAQDAAAAVAHADIVVLAVKPQDVPSVLAPLAAGLAARRPLLLSVVAGVRIATLESLTPSLRVLRAMPNRPALLGAGAAGVYAPPSVGAVARRAAEQLLGAVGEVVWVDAEEQLELVTALSGSGPAYFFLLAELMAAAAVRLGLAEPGARRLAAATLYGSGLMAQGETDLARLRSEITSPGGTTAAALREFAAADLAGIVERALAAAAQRGGELGASAR
jgi:pyrroline-5-carboxylate reductase